MRNTHTYTPNIGAYSLTTQDQEILLTEVQTRASAACGERVKCSHAQERRIQPVQYQSLGVGLPTLPSEPGVSIALEALIGLSRR